MCPTPCTQTGTILSSLNVGEEVSHPKTRGKNGLCFIWQMERYKAAKPFKILRAQIF
jgi:hypothetical protein